MSRTAPLQSARTAAFLVLASRLGLFLFFQALIALLAGSWQVSERYWLLTATLTNLVSIALLFLLYQKDGKRYLDLFTIDRSTLKQDLRIFAGLVLIAIPVALVPGYFLSLLIWGDPDVPTTLMFFPIEEWLVYLLLLAFPLTIALAELATYFMYVMPKLKATLRTKWLAVALPILFLSIQHVTLPFIPDPPFMLYRALVFLPFSALIGISLYYRPSLFVYFAVLHGIMDFGTAYMFLLELR